MIHYVEVRGASCKRLVTVAHNTEKNPIDIGITAEIHIGEYCCQKSIS